jgi:hypothetical protein
MKMSLAHGPPVFALTGALALTQQENEAVAAGIVFAFA